MQFKKLHNHLKISVISLGTVLTFNNICLAQVSNIDEYDPESINSMSQINSVSQLRDVSPTDWAYESLRSLVERYGCIVGYPDRTFRGNRA